MLCTACNRPVRPVVALDIDGTLGQYHRHFLEFACGWFGRQFSMDYDGSLSFAQHMRVTDEQYRTCKLAYRQGGGKRMMPRYEGATEIALELNGDGIEVWITTTRPYMRFDSTDPDTREWLQRNGISYEGLIYDDDKYARLLDIVGKRRVIGVVEDLPEQYDRAEALGLAPIMVARNHNVNSRRSTVAGSLYVAARMLRDRAKGWREANGYS